MRIRWIRLLTALPMAVLIAVLPICAVAAEGAGPFARQDEGGEPARPEDELIVVDGEDEADKDQEDGQGKENGPDQAPGDSSADIADTPQRTLTKALATLKVGGHDPYMSGTSDGRFRPNAPITRAEVAQVIYNLLETKPESAAADFTDVAATHWGYKAIAAMNTLGVMTGSRNRFRPGDNITRAEFVVIVSRCFDLPEGESTFPDVPDTHWAYDEIAAVQQKGWINGYSNGNFGPDDDITRCEAVRVMNNALGRRDDNFAADRDTQEFPDVPKSHWAFLDIAEAADPVKKPDPPPPVDPDPPEPTGIQVGSTVRVVADTGLNIRRAPVDGAVITAVPNGTLLTVTDISRAPWYGVRTSGGVSGYASGDYLVLYDGSTGDPQGGALSASSLTINQYMSARLDATADKQVSAMKWSSSDPDVAKVGYTINYSSTRQSAIVYAGNPGTAVLTYSDGAGNRKASCTVTVTAAEPVRFAYPSESIVQKGAEFDLIAITDDSRDEVRFDIAGGPGSGSFTTNSFTAESNRSQHGLPDNNTRVFRRTVSFGTAGSYTLRAYSAKDGSYSAGYKTFTVEVKDSFSYSAVTGEARTVSSKGLEVIRDFEGIVHEVEDDVLVAGNPTVGCGYVVSKANETFYNNMTSAECYAMLEKTAKDGAYSRAVENFRKSHNIKMSQGQFDALVSWVYNIGTGYLSQGESDAADMILNMVVPPTVSASKPATGVVNTSSGANPAVLYASTSTTSAKQGNIPAGATVKVTEVKVIRSARVQQVWYKTSYGGKTGWVGSGYVKLSGSHQIDLSYADSTSLATELLLWHMASGSVTPGLVYRRLDECKIFFFGDYTEGKPNGVETPNYRKNTYGFVYPDRIKYLDKR